MLEAYRLTIPPFNSLRESFSGEGAKAEGGRWNSEGTAVVYLAENHSLALLETLSKMNEEYQGMEFSFYRISISDDLSETVYSVDDLPENWRQSPPPVETQNLGNEWYVEKDSTLLRVPSAVMPFENNLVVRPHITDRSDTQIEGPISYSLDSRLF